MTDFVLRKVLVMKKLIASLLSALLACSLASCSSAPASSPAISSEVSSSSDPTPEFSPSSTPEPTPVDLTATSAPAELGGRFEAFETGLADLGLTYSERTAIAAEMIGGTTGYRYTFDDFKVEVYEFDPESDAYKQAESAGAVTMEGFGSFPAYFNNGMVMIESDGLPQAVLDLFDSL